MIPLAHLTLPQGYDASVPPWCKLDVTLECYWQLREIMERE